MAEDPKERVGAAFEDGLEIKVANDKMRVAVDIGVENIEKWSVERLIRELAAEGVLYGVDKEKIDRLFEQKLFNQNVDVAFGKRATDGTDGQVELHVDMSRARGKPKESQDGRVDLKDLGVFMVVGKDLHLAELKPPTKGKDGKDVYGTVIPAKPGKEAKLSGGKGTRLSEDGKNLYADTDGILEGTAEKIEINPALVVQGNVGYETGHIDSNVGVAINGTVLAGFSVKSKEDVCITGVVEAAEITSDKNITITAGIQGDGRAVLKAEGAITAAFANEAKLISKQGVYAKGGITHCEIECGGIVEADGPRGVIVGGDVIAGFEISANTIGSELGAKTNIQIGPDLLALEQRAKEIHDQRESLEANVAKLQQVLKILQAARATGQKLPAPKMKMAQQAIKAHSELTKQAEILTQKDEALQGRVKVERGIRRYIRVKDTIWPGTSIRILNARMTVKNPMKAVLLTLENREIETYAYRERGSKAESKKKKEESKKKAEGAAAK